MQGGSNMTNPERIAANFSFLEQYKTADSFLRDAYRTERGISDYISMMEANEVKGRLLVSTWQQDYRMLKHLRWARNQLTHERGFDADLLAPEDYAWMRCFNDRLLQGGDPISAMARAERKQAQRTVQQQPFHQPPKQPYRQPLKENPPPVRRKTLWEIIKSFFR